VRIKLLLFVGAVYLASNGCARDPLDGQCPNLSPGDLVITELRGDQSGADTYGQWIELYNDSSASIHLYGAEVQVVRLDGGAEGHILVRAPDVVVAAGDYVVLGQFATGAEPDHVDYGYELDFTSDLYDSGAVDVVACGIRIDRAIYHDLPLHGTLGLDGTIAPPDADANDDEASWCVDDNDDQPDPSEFGIKGTPGQGNIACL
jgi:hypothetical protein